MAQSRTRRNKTTAAFLADAVFDYLPEIVAELQALGIPSIAGSARPARLPMDARMLEGLKQGAQTTGIPATRLLAACILRASRSSAD
jgi:hypothetical protein